MIIHNTYIARENMIEYFKVVTNINNWLTVPQLRTLNWFEQIVTTKLHLVTKVFQVTDTESQISSLFRYVHSPIRTYFKFRQLKQFMACCSRTIGCSHTLKTKNHIQCYDIAKDVYTRLSKLFPSHLTYTYRSEIRRQLVLLPKR